MISIIVPVYNAELYLDRCIKSILNQTYREFELILIDDGSTDSSLSICKNYASQDSRIVIISKKNEGAGLARNEGLKIANGDYIGFVDSDDYISPDMYREMYRKAIENDADIVQCGYLKVDEKDKIITKSNYQNKIINKGELCFKEYCKRKNIDNYSPCKIFKRKILEDIYFGNYCYSEDAYFIIQAFLNCKKLVVISSNYYYYVQTFGSACRRPYSVKYIDTITVGEYMYDLTKKHYPHLAYYFARYTAVWCRFNYWGTKNNEFYSKIVVNEFLLKFQKYYALSKIYVPYNMETFLLLLFRVSPKLYGYFKKG